MIDACKNCGEPKRDHLLIDAPQEGCSALICPNAVYVEDIDPLVDALNNMAEKNPEAARELAEIIVGDPTPSPLALWAKANSR
ncbi:MAG: hypothetical protein ACYTG5_19390 [Planctomycetota bacterium]|jgi:hypothetical protein